MKWGCEYSWGLEGLHSPASPSHRLGAQGLAANLRLGKISLDHQALLQMRLLLNAEEDDLQGLTSVAHAKNLNYNLLDW